MTISIETENAGTYPDVDEAQIIDLSERLADGMVFLIVNDSTRDMEYAQAAHAIDPGSGQPVPGSYVIEYHDARDYHYQATVDATAEVGRFLAAWAWQRDGWKDGFQWKELKEMRGANQPR